MFFAALTPLLPDTRRTSDFPRPAPACSRPRYPLGVLVGSIPSGFAAARFGVKPTAIAALLLLATTSIVFGLADSIIVLDLTRFIQGIADACAWTAAFAWLIAVAPGERRGQLIGTVVGVAIAGALFGPVLGGLASVVGTAPVFGGVAVLALVVLAAALASEAPPAGERQSIRRLWDALSDRRIMGGLWLVALPALLFGTLTVLVPLTAVRVRRGGRSDRRGVPRVCRSPRRASPPSWVACPTAEAGDIRSRSDWWPRPSGPPCCRGRRRGSSLALVTVLAASAFGTFWAPAMSLLSRHRGTHWARGGLGLRARQPRVGTGTSVRSGRGRRLARATSDTVPYLILSACCLATLVAVRRA